MKPLAKLHPSQRLMYGLVRAALEYKGTAPSRRELRKVLKVKSLNTVQYHLGVLCAEGYLEMDQYGKLAIPDQRRVPEEVSKILQEWKKVGITLHQVVREWRRL